MFCVLVLEENIKKFIVMVLQGQNKMEIICKIFNGIVIILSNI